MSQSDFAMLAERGAIFTDASEWLRPEWKANPLLAFDAVPAISSTSNSAIPSQFTTIVDPNIIEYLFSPNRAVDIFGEVKRGTWTTETAIFRTIEFDGEVASYTDRSNNGRVGLNVTFPQYQSYLYQTIKELGEREIDRMGEALIDWTSKMNRAAITILNKMQNYTYFFGVQGLNNWGLLTDPNLSASLTPAPKAAGGNTWFTSGGNVNATANEVYNDILVLFNQLVAQTLGIIDINSGTNLVLALPPLEETALKFKNTYGLSAQEMLQGVLPNLRIVNAQQYGVLTSSNTQGLAGGNMMQMIATSVDGQETGYCAFNEKLRTHRIIFELSSFKQKMTQGTWGAIILQPLAFVSMLGI